jgi:hypothetical protein
MVTSKLLLEYVDERISIVSSQIEALILAITKYATSPVCVMQFLISKINLKPTVILSAFNDKNLIASLTKADNLLNTTMMEVSPEATLPTIVVYPTAIDIKDIIYNVSEEYYYSSAYLIDVPGMKKVIKENGIKRFALYTNNDRNYVSSNIEISQSVGIMKLPEIQVMPIKLPFRNIIKINPRYEDIIKAIIEEDVIRVASEDIDSIFNTIKKEQIFDISGIKLLKDFVKQKPKTLNVYEKTSTSGEDTIITVCLHMEFDNKLTHILFYRYIDGVVEKILGNIEEVKNGQ